MGQRSKSADEFTCRQFDYIITVCDNARETCPFFPGHDERIHPSFENPPVPGAADPKTTMAIFRRVRDEILGVAEE
jgi:arsenate reductase (thioredoxin)